jgi:hypothetical protein
MFAFVGLKDTTKFAENSLCKSIKDSIKCQLETLVSFKGCKYEDWHQQNGKSAILGLHSNWIGTNILGTSRPSNKLIQEHNIIAQVTALLSLCVSLCVCVYVSPHVSWVDYHLLTPKLVSGFHRIPIMWSWPIWLKFNAYLCNFYFGPVQALWNKLHLQSSSSRRACQLWAWSEEL